MQFLLKLLAANIIILVCAKIGSKSPSLGGLIATMPITSLLVMIWLYMDNPGDYRLMAEYSRGVVWGIIPTILFFSVTLISFRRQIPLPLTLCAAFAVWILGASIHQYFLK